jgi:act minimal PKS chain-length factor (CLF/KS beta)
MTSVVVTGLGIVAPNGVGTDAYWSATLEGRSGLGRVSRFDPSPYPATLAGEVTGFDPAEHVSGRLIPQTDRMTQLAIAASDWALRDAAVDVTAYDPFEAGVVTAGASGGFEFGHQELQNLWSQGPAYVSAYQSFAWFYAVNTGQISIRNGLRGPGAVLVTEQAGGLDALAQARRQIRGGSLLTVCGAVDSSMCPWGWTAQLTSGRLSRCDDPDRAYLPFDRRAAGYVPGEGGAFLILEDAAAVARRGTAHVYGEIAGYGATFDPLPGQGDPGLARAITVALADAGVTPRQVDVVFADGAGVPDLDRQEATAINAVFGQGCVPVTVPKTMTGRMHSAGAALDVATALLAIRDQVIPPTVNVTEPAPGAALDLVAGEARPARVRTALVLARGYGGFNAAMVIRDSPGASSITTDAEGDSQQCLN